MKKTIKTNTITITTEELQAQIQKAVALAMSAVAPQVEATKKKQATKKEDTLVSWLTKKVVKSINYTTDKALAPTEVWMRDEAAPLALETTAKSTGWLATKLDTFSKAAGEKAESLRADDNKAAKIAAIKAQLAELEAN